ncbi:hypothetical protein E2320_001238, partial [Naja naja]
KKGDDQQCKNTQVSGLSWQRRQDPPHLAAGKGRYTLHPFDRKEERKQSPTAKTVVSPPRLWISK